MYPEIQDRLYEELHSVYDSQDEYTSYEKVQQMPYLDMVLKEGMRMFPVAPFIVRTATVDTPVSTCIIPKNAIIMMSIFNVQRVIYHILKIKLSKYRFLCGNFLFRERTFGAKMLKNSIQNTFCLRNPIHDIHSVSFRSAEVHATASVRIHNCYNFLLKSNALKQMFEIRKFHEFFFNI